MRDSCGSSGTGETPQAFTPRRLTARPVESEHLEGKSTTPLYLVNSNKVCENSLFIYIAYPHPCVYCGYILKILTKIKYNNSLY